MIYENGANDPHSITPVAMNAFIELGMEVYMDPEKILKNEEISKNPCLLIRCIIAHPGVSLLANSATVSVYDCSNKRIYYEKGMSTMGMDPSGDFRIATKKALKKIRKSGYRFDPHKTQEFDWPEVENTDETEESLKGYFDSADIHPIEGIYKSFGESETMRNYRIGIKRYGREFKAIILKSEQSHWKIGEVKAKIEMSSIMNVYSVEWFMSNKTSVETMAHLEEESVLYIDFEKQNPNDKEAKFLKLYPTNLHTSESSSPSKKSSGSGFLLNSDGVIATNAHVIEGANTIEVRFSSTEGARTYKAKVLLKDETNDVALIEVLADSNSNFKNPPYRLENDINAGQKVFTLGFPLNEIMGSNFKVSDGIVNSVTGLRDDVRHFQSSIAVQPGNSGGPIFNTKGNVVGIATSRLNEDAIGTSIENVSYGIKSSYINNIYRMIPGAPSLKPSTELSELELEALVKKVSDYVCLISVY